MALIRWLSRLASRDLPGTVGPLLVAQGFVIDAEVTSEVQVFATDPQHAPIPMDQRVSCLAQWTDRRAGEIQIELRSSEPMLKRDTRCGAAASRLRHLIPPH
ncbi:MAG: hypothetical protein FJ060_11510 [Cyanobacteria bacterium K_Offshore_0m_m2_072]|nr:hypothetical protein [Cyanobacteria bacterium K_Offshore_0m_m2_072]